MPVCLSVCHFIVDYIIFSNSFSFDKEQDVAPW